MKVNKIITLSALFVLVSLFAFAGIRNSGAWFSDYVELNGDASLKLSHQTSVIEDIDEGSNKHITIKNTGETDVVVRVKVFGGSYVEITSGENWKLSDDDWYYYEKVLTPDEVSSEIYANITSSAPDHDFDVVVILESERAVYNGDQLIAPNTDWKITYPKGGNE